MSTPFHHNSLTMDCAPLEFGRIMDVRVNITIGYGSFQNDLQCVFSKNRTNFTKKKPNSTFFKLKLEQIKYECGYTPNVLWRENQKNPIFWFERKFFYRLNHKKASDLVL